MAALKLPSRAAHSKMRSSRIGGIGSNGDGVGILKRLSK